jgi:anti-anti-sigma factor
MLHVREHQHHTTRILTLTGRFDRRTTPGIQVLILAAQKTGSHHIILDFSGVTEIDSKGIKTLLLWYHKMKLTHLKISVVKPPAYLRYHLAWADLSENFSIHASEEDAVEHDCACS